MVQKILCLNKCFLKFLTFYVTCSFSESHFFKKFDLWISYECIPAGTQLVLYTFVSNTLFLYHFNIITFCEVLIPHSW